MNKGSYTINLERLAQPVATNDYLIAKIYYAGVTTRYYTVEARAFAGYDSSSGIPGEAVVLHDVDTTRSDRRSQVVDVDNNGNPNDAGAMWTPGETFTDTDKGITVTVNSKSATSFNVTITLRDTITPHIVTTSADSGPGSLRNAMDWANHFPGTTIQFHLPASDPSYSNGVFTLAPAAALPEITADGTMLDATTQAGFVSNTKVMLNGSQAGQLVDGLVLSAAHCTVRGLTIGGFSMNGIRMEGAEANGNTVQGCFIGTDAAGAAAVPNRWNGIAIWNGAHHNTIGGTTTAARNLISGNSFDGISITGAETHHNVVQGNFIGTNAAGSAALPNAGRGLSMQAGAHDNTVGGTKAGARNLISGNTQSGVILSDSATVGNTVRGNSIFGNGRLGINLAGGSENSAGVTANHTGSASGPNNLQNYPILSDITGPGGIVIGTLESLPNAAFALDFYLNDQPDPSGYGEGRRYLMTQTATTNAQGKANFRFPMPFAVGYVSATATNLATGDTSEFGPDLAISLTLGKKRSPLPLPTPRPH
ncbi:MAG TPA: hypothetical protein VFB21_01895, partial [Chthonomonadaceae bacterium]|nr:hypothetical protein [Chthonomonadaceae bacterium]